MGFAKKLLRLCLVELANTRNLDSNDPVEFGVACLPDAAELARPYLIEQLEMSDSFSLMVVSRRRSSNKTKMTAARRALDVAKS